MIAEEAFTREHHWRHDAGRNCRDSDAQRAPQVARGDAHSLQTANPSYYQDLRRGQRLSPAGRTAQDSAAGSRDLPSSLEQNQESSAARIAAVARSTVPFLAYVNAEALPKLDWLVTRVDYLGSCPSLEACCIRLASATPDRLLTRWRMHSPETMFGEQSDPTPFALGHAVLFRKEIVASVGGYNPHFRRHHRSD